MRTIQFHLVLGMTFFLGTAPALQAQSFKLEKTDKTPEGFVRHTFTSEYQQGPTEIQVLLPDRLEAGKRYPVLFVLPVEAGNGSQYGNGLVEIKKLELHNKIGVIFVLATFSHLPWYADHPTDRRIRQETYFVQVVLPFVAQHYPVRTDAAGRWLLGFSKSGWGAFSLLLRHPQLFGRAVAWDAPLNMALPNRFGMAAIFGSEENFARYRLTTLLEKAAPDLRRPGPRLCLLGHCSFQDHHQAVHALLDRLHIPHEYRPEHRQPHSWHSGWVADGVRWLAAGAAK